MTTAQTTKERTEQKQHAEGKTTQMIEKTTAAIPSGMFLVLAGGAIAGSLVLKLLGRHSTANFVGEWVPTILMLGLYNKMVKMLGTERPEVGWERQKAGQERPSNGPGQERQAGQAGQASPAGQERQTGQERPGGSHDRPGFSH
ncbi:MAG TPA: hypothetical protein VHN14_28230 [Kofleriaceae bacterium]|nr:hypothetical protein [Kofleriaceae bacterium]